MSVKANAWWFYIPHEYPESLLFLSLPEEGSPMSIKETNMNEEKSFFSHKHTHSHIFYSKVIHSHYFQHTHCSVTQRCARWKVGKWVAWCLLTSYGAEGPSTGRLTLCLTAQPCRHTGNTQTLDCLWQEEWVDTFSLNLSVLRMKLVPSALPFESRTSVVTYTLHFIGIMSGSGRAWELGNLWQLSLGNRIY